MLVRLISILLVSVSSVVAQERVIGLLTLLEVFGEGPCHEFTPEEVPLYSEKGSEDTIGSIRVASYWIFSDDGGCEGLRVHVYKDDGTRGGALPTEEFDYEAPAAIVLEEQNPWFRVRLSNGAAWVRVSENNEYYPLEELLLNGLTYITDASEPALLDRPDGVVVATASTGDSVQVVDFMRIDNQLWLHVEVLSHSVCESADEPKVLFQGWLRAHGSSGQPSVWFYSRGC